MGEREAMTYDRYIVPEDEDFEPGSTGGVLKNLLSIKDSGLIEQLESEELYKLSKELFGLYDEDYQFLAEDVCNLHESWLVSIYPFAGKYRSVMMSKGDFPFASPERIPALMSELELKYLKKYTPCRGMNNLALAEALGIVHVELIIIHPFRDGNGRVARMLANLMALQAGKDMINYSSIDKTINKTGYENYIQAIHDGFSGDYQRIKNIFLELIESN